MGDGRFNAIIWQLKVIAMRAPLKEYETVIENPLSIRGTKAADSEQEVRAWVKSNGHSKK